MTHIIDLKPLWEERSKVGDHANSRSRGISVVIVATDSVPVLLKTLQSLASQPFIREVIVVQSEFSPLSEATLEKLMEAHPSCYLVKGSSTSGLADAYNLGAQYASGNFLLFLAANCALPADATSDLLHVGIRKPGLWAVGIQYPHNAKSGMFSAFWKRGWETIVNKITKFTIYNQNKTASLIEVSLPGGGFYTSVVPPHCLLVPARVFGEMRGFNRRCFHSVFHVDFCLRLHLLGGGIYQSKVVAHQEQSRPSLSMWKYIIHQWRGFYGWYHLSNVAIKASCSDNDNIPQPSLANRAT